ncbi:MAG TPA: acyltransferase family protein [Anaerolineales bacterium]|nr:acyltransferase family protein [Anaerolineales bacterium]
MNSSTHLPYIRGLDGIRAIAVLAVLCYHANFPWALGGFLGVETFFVLSGFLITALLLNEWQASGRIDLRNFWLRRARRLLPAVWALLVTLPFLATLFAPDALARLREDVPAALFYITNWVYIFREVPYFEVFGRPPLLQQLWSLAVEEQFYLLWPILLVFLLRRRKSDRSQLIGVIILMIVISSAWMAILYSPEVDPLRVYYGTDTRAAGFLVGALLAIVWTPSEASVSLGRGKLEFLGWSGLITLLILFNYLNEFRPFLYRGGILLTALASATLIVGASSPVTSLSKFLEHRLLRWIGTRSYGIYLWHWPIFMMTRPGMDIHLPAAVVRLGQLAMTFALAELSYRWIETPIRRHGFRSSLRTWQAALKRWPVPRKLGVGAGVLCAGLLLAWQGFLPITTNSPASVISINTTPPEISSQDTVQIAEPASPVAPTIAARNEAPALEPRPSATPASNLPRVTFIGDSIMQGASPMMEDRLGQDIYIDAARKRRMEDVPDLIDILAEEQHLARTVVIHLGSNRPFEAALLDRVIRSLLAHDVERAIFINVHRPIGWESYLNRQFAEGLARWPQAELIDWDAMAHSRQEWFIEDGTHLSYKGSEAYVSAIQDKLESGP